MERTESMGEAQVPKDKFFHAIKALVLVKKMYKLLNITTAYLLEIKFIGLSLE